MTQVCAIVGVAVPLVAGEKLVGVHPVGQVGVFHSQVKLGQYIINLVAQGSCSDIVIIVDIGSLAKVPVIQEQREVELDLPESEGKVHASEFIVLVAPLNFAYIIKGERITLPPL